VAGSGVNGGVEEEWTQVLWAVRNVTDTPRCTTSVQKGTAQVPSWPKT
jgi:hypothetical protein